MDDGKTTKRHFLKALGAFLAAPLAAMAAGKYVRCNFCSGEGKYTCGSCSGGRRSEGGGKYRACSTCSGTGKRRCSRCDGKGVVYVS